MMRTRIKICGIRDTETALVAIDAGADILGIVLTPDSPRYIDIERSNQIFKALPPFISTAGVYRTQPLSDVQRWRGPWVQLHGGEDETFAERTHKRVIKGFQFNEAHIRRWDACNAVVALLIDGSSGGKGESFAHEELAKLMPSIQKPVLLAGGLTPDNVGNAIRTVRPYAVDVSSGVESSPGQKDQNLIRAFCEAVHDADAQLAHQSD